MLTEVAVTLAADSDAKELDRQRILLCITKAEIETIQRETCGRLFQTVSLPYCSTPSHGKLRLAENSVHASRGVDFVLGQVALMISTLKGFMTVLYVAHAT